MKRMLFALVALLLVGAPNALAQLTTATISGTVTDGSGGVLPGVAVTVKHVETGVSRAVVSDAGGRYEAPSLPLGPYEVRAELSGFKPLVRTGISLTVGRHAVVDMTLEVGGMQEAVTVVGEAALLETRTATVSDLIDSKRVEELPLNGRDLTQLTYLQPGIIKIPRTGGGVFSGMGDVISVAGSRGNQNLYLLDGVASSDLSGNPQSAMGSYVGAETVQEFQIVTNNYSAEYRSQPGGIISAVTKSGTNSLRGSAFWTHRNDSLDSANYFDTAFSVKPDFSRHQAGGSIGGPVLRDKTFFFASYEGLDERLGVSDTITVPSMLMRQGILPGGRVVPVNARSQPYLSLWPVPGQGNSIIRENADGTIQIGGVENRPTKGDYFLGKVDHHLGRFGRLAVTYNYDAADRSISGMRSRVGAATSGAGDGLADASTKHVFSAKHTSIWSKTFVNELSVGYSSTKPEGSIPFDPQDFGTLPFLPQRDLLGELGVNSVASLGYRTILDAYGQYIWTIQNAVSWNRGKHSLRFGGEINPMDLTQESCARGCNGVYSFESFEKFLLAEPQSFEATLPQGDTPNRDLRQWLFGAYFQDNWSVRSDLTLNLGLRYEYMTVPEEANGATGSLVEYSDTSVQIGPLYKNATARSFSPRLGVAWAPGDRKTSLRGGFGIYYEHPSLYHARTTMQELPPFTQVGSVNQTDLTPRGIQLRFPDAYSTQLDLLSAAVNIRSLMFNMDTMYGYRWNAMVQRELPGKWVASVGYTGSQYHNLLIQSIGHIRRWQGFPDQPVEGPKFFPVGAGRVNPTWADMRLQHTSGEADYDGLTVGLQKRLSHGLDMQVSYAYSTAHDQGSGVSSGGDNFSQGQRTVQGFWDLYLDYGLSSFDVRNFFTTNFTYQLPGDNLTGFVGALAKGWRVNGILMITDGFPLSVSGSTTASTNRIGNGDGLRANLVPGGDPNPVLGGPDHYFDETQFSPVTAGFFGTAPRNSLITPGLATFDLGFSKAFPVFGGRRSIQFRGEVFNLFNRANFGTPNTSIINNTGVPNPNVGRITSTRTTARQIQLGLRFVF